MIPLRHTEKTRRPPVVTWTFIFLILGVFTVQVLTAPMANPVIQLFGFIPLRLMHPSLYGYTPVEAVFTLASSLFLHGGFVHVIGNLIYLGVFGPFVEDRLGRTRYAIFFIAAGMAGSLTHTLLFPASRVPSIGASGSIAGILGAFLVFSPAARIVALIPFVVSYAIAEIPAIVFLPIWFLLQFLNGWFAISSAGSTEGVAWWAHVGGFLVGVGVAVLSRVRVRRLVPAPGSGTSRMP